MHLNKVSAMQITPFDLLGLPWAILFVYWIAVARHVNLTTRAETGPSRVIQAAIESAAFLLLMVPKLSFGFLGQRFIAVTPLSFILGLVLTCTGTGFAIWARHELGQNWSGTVTIKAGHHLIETGPYALSRHPIYTGVLCALLGTAIALGEWRGLLAVAVMLLALARKVPLEERWLTEQFPGDYPLYHRRVKALVPFLF